MHPTPQIPTDPTARDDLPLTIAQGPTAGMGRCALMNRVSRVLQDMAAARLVSDLDLRQHAADCSALMEQAYARFEEHGIPADREEAVLWMHHRDHALRSFSPQWVAQRQAEIQQEITRGLGFFVTEGDADRATLAGKTA